MFDLGVIDGFVAGGEVSSVAKVFRPEKAYLKNNHFAESTHNGSIFATLSLEP